MSKLENNTTSLQAILETVNNLPKVKEQKQSCSLRINNSTGNLFDLYCSMGNEYKTLENISSISFETNIDSNSICAIRISIDSSNAVLRYDEPQIETIVEGAFTWNSNYKWFIFVIKDVKEAVMGLEDFGVGEPS